MTTGRTAAVTISVRDAEKAVAAFRSLGKEGSAEFRRLEDSLKPVSRTSEAVGSAFRGLGREAEGLTTRLGPVGAALRTLGPGGIAAGAAVAGVGLLTVALGRSAVETAAWASTLETARARTTLSAAALQELRYAAQQNDITTQTLDQGMQRLSRRLAEAAQGSGELTGVLQQYGIAVTDSAGRTRSTEAVLVDLAEAIKGAGSEQERLRIAFKAFDSEGAAFVSFLSDGEAGLARLRDEARRLGVVLDDEAIAKAAEADQAFKRFGLASEALERSLSIGLLPVMADVAEAMATIISKADDITAGFASLPPIFAPFTAGVRLGRAAREIFTDGDRPKASGVPFIGEGNFAGDAANQRARQGRIAGQSPADEKLRLDLLKQEIAAEEIILDRGKARLKVAEDAAKLEAKIAAEGVAAAERVSKSYDQQVEATDLLRLQNDLRAAGRDDVEVVVDLERYRVELGRDNVANAEELVRQREIELRRQADLNAADERRRQGQRDAAQAAREFERAQESALRQQERFAERIGDTLFDAFKDGGERGKDAVLRFLEEIARTQIVIPIVGSFLGVPSAGGGTGFASAFGGGGGGGGFGQALNFASSFIPKPGLGSLSSALNLGGGFFGASAAGLTSTAGGLASSLGVAAVPGGIVNAASASAGLFGGGGILGLGAAGGPLALAALAGGGLLASSLFNRTETPRAGARVGQARNGQLFVSGAGADNGGDAGPAQAEARRLSDAVNALVELTGGRLNIANQPGLSLAIRSENGSITRGGDDVFRQLISSGALSGLGGNLAEVAQSSGIEEVVRGAGFLRSAGDQVQQLRDPLGAALTAIQREFKGLEADAERFGFSLSDLEELKQARITAAVRQATDAQLALYQGVADQAVELARRLREADAAAAGLSGDFAGLANDLRGAQASLSSSRLGLIAGDLSPEPLARRVVSADAAFARAATAARSGDLEALRAAPGLLETSLRLGQQFDGSSVRQANRFNAGVQTLESLERVAGAGAGVADRSSALLTEVVASLNRAEGPNIGELQQQTAALRTIARDTEAAAAGNADLARRVDDLTRVMNQLANAIANKAA